MLTIEALERFGADTKEGLGRCMNNKDIYLRLVDMGLNDTNFEKLSAAVNAGDKKTAFEAAHALKGVMGNLSLTPLFTIASEMTERLRAEEDADYPTYLKQLLEKRAELRALQES